ncbi:hypothetical protein [Streptomyces sp. NBC_01304]|nr:hypothetical protein OG430_10375 [Streptomyces sp. NBC_01304]
MAIFAVLIPVVMLGVVLALGRYEELMLPPAQEADDRGGAGMAPTA